MEDFLKLTEDVFEEYVNIERTATFNFEKTKKSMEDMFKNAIRNLKSEQTPQQNKKKAKRLSNICDEQEESISSEQDEMKTLRPVRSTRLKAIKSMKEPSIKSKIRQPVVKLERISDETLNKENNINSSNATFNKTKQSQGELRIRNTDIAPETINLNKTQTLPNLPVVPVESTVQEKNILNNESVGSETSHNKKDEEISNKNLDDSVVILPPVLVKVEVLSDCESDKMPPPAIPEAKAKRTKKKKASTATDAKATTSFRNTRSRIKREQMDEQNTADDSDDTASKKEQTKVVTEEAKKSIANSTIESVYEDASNEGFNLKPVVVLERCVVPTFSDKQDSPKLDATFVSPEPQITPNTLSANDTFVLSSNSEVKSVENQVDKCDETFFVAVSSNVANETITISSNVELETKTSVNDATYGSIMTEDASDDEAVVEVLSPSKQLTNTISKSATNVTFIKPKNELFSPFMQSPIKKKIEAFEQAVAESVERQTRTKTRAKAAIAKPDPSSIQRQIKAATPNIDARSYRQNTPMHQDEKVGGLLGKKHMSNSTSKLAHIQKSLQAQPKSVTSITQTKCNSVNSLLSRENSVEDLRHGVPLQSLEAKRKKREEKQRLALQLRETKEKERREQTEKLIREREEKVKRMLQEKEERARQDMLKKKMLKDQVEQRRQLEEINRNFRIQQQQKEMMLKLQNEQRLEKELSERDYIETLKREKAAKDLMRLNQEKEMLKLTLLKNKEKAARELLKKSKIVKYDFDILGSEDSTDEEGKQTTKKPEPPAWSRSNVRQIAIEQQTYVNSKLIDSLFSIAPMSPDLREIFPAIDPKCLRRKSSAVWNTPPRYTLLPKH